MTDNEIIKAVEGAILNSKRYDSKVWPIEVYKLENALDLITRQQAEIERLKNENMAKEAEYNDMLEQRNSVEEYLETAKSEAVKEFAEKMKRYIDVGHLRPPTEICFSELDVVKMIDKTAEEMLGE